MQKKNWYHTFRIHLPNYEDIDRLPDLCSGTIRTRDMGNLCDQLMHTFETLN